MKKDIDFKPVEDVYMAVVQTDNADLWQVYLLNRGKSRLETVLVTSRGYGKKEGEIQETSILRHSIPHVEAGEFARIEPINRDVFHLTNEYWVSFFIDGQIYDKKYLFVPDSLTESNTIEIKELKLKGVLHS
jgi:hypothetical protein